MSDYTLFGWTSELEAVYLAFGFAYNKNETYYTSMVRRENTVCLTAHNNIRSMALSLNDDAKVILRKTLLLEQYEVTTVLDEDGSVTQYERRFRPHDKPSDIHEIYIDSEDKRTQARNQVLKIAYDLAPHMYLVPSLSPTMLLRPKPDVNLAAIIGTPPQPAP